MAKKKKIVCLIIPSFFLVLHNFDHCVLPMLFENEMYLTFLTL
jgi:formate/nitrite transporter FocA (FNT family)